MTIQRLDELCEPVEIDRYYLVPTVIGEWDGRVKAWPVIGPQNNDTQCLNFDDQHYHFDARFIPAPRDADLWFWRRAFAAPLSTKPRLNEGGFEPPVWRRRKCKRLDNPFIHDMHNLASRHGTWKCHFDMWTGKQARHDGRGWVCPHRKVPLADHPAVDGVITCPLHLLRVDAATGHILSPLSSEAPT